MKGKKLEAGDDAETMKAGTYWLVPHGLLSLRSYTTQVPLPRGIPLTVGCALLINHWSRNTPHNCVQVNC